MFASKPEIKKEQKNIDFQRQWFVAISYTISPEDKILMYYSV
jgi:hypothetical protein